MKKRFLCLFLCISFILPLISVSPLEVFSATDNKCGDNLTWEIKTDADTKTLVISGSGPMYDYDYDYDTTDIDMPPWAEYLGVKYYEGKITGLDNLSKIGYIDLSSDITHIGNYAFYRFISLFKPAELPDELKSIGRCAFRECTNLYQIKFADNLTEIGTGAFYKCPKLAKITMSKSLTTLGNLAFNECTALENITLYPGLKTIGQRVFDGCTKLLSITIPNTVESLAEKAFNNCTSLTFVDFGGAATTISDMAFYNCVELVSTLNMESVKSIGAQAFYGCKKLEFVDMSNVTLIAAQSFALCSNLTNITNMSSVESIGTQAFYGCTKLESINISKTVSSIGAAAFSACLSLKEVNVDPDNTKYVSVDGNLFNKDITILYQYALGKSAEAYAIPDTVKGISVLSLAYCNLKSLGMGKNVTTIGQDILSHSEALVYYEGSADDFSKMSVNDKNDDLKANLKYNTPLYGVVSDVTTNNGDVVISANYAFGKNGDCLAYAGIYDQNGVLIQAVKADKAETEFVLSDTEISAGYTARLFFWNNETEFKPIGITTSLKI